MNQHVYLLIQLSSLYSIMHLKGNELFKNETSTNEKVLFFVSTNLVKLFVYKDQNYRINLSLCQNVYSKLKKI